jgi:hypothetical protein
LVEGHVNNHGENLARAIECRKSKK